MTSRVIVRNKGKRPEFFSEGFTLVIIHTHSYPPPLYLPVTWFSIEESLDPGCRSITGLKLRVRTFFLKSESLLRRLQVSDSVEGSWAHYGSDRPSRCSLVLPVTSNSVGAFTSCWDLVGLLADLMWSLSGDLTAVPGLAITLFVVLGVNEQTCSSLFTAWRY